MRIEKLDREKWVKTLKLELEKLTQQELAKLMGITQASLSRILSGKRTGNRIYQRFKKNDETGIELD